MEFFPLGVLPDQSGLILYEAGYLGENDWWNFSNCLSPFWRLYYNFQPGHRVIFSQVAYELGPAHLMLIPDHQLFHSVGETPVPHCWLTFNVTRRLAPEQSVPVLLSPDQTERELLARLARQFTGVGEGDCQAILHTSLALLHLVLIRPEIRWREPQLSEGLVRACRRIEAEYSKPLHLADLARTAGHCERSFARLFTSWRGVSPTRFLSQVRVREAASLLVNTDLSLDEIAERTGFPDRYYMSRVFKRIIGDSPAHFRKSHALKPSHLPAS